MDEYVTISFKLEKKLKEKIEKIATNKGLTLPEYMHKLIIEDLEREKRMLLNLAILLGIDKDKIKKLEELLEEEGGVNRSNRRG